MDAPLTSLKLCKQLVATHLCHQMQMTAGVRKFYKQNSREWAFGVRIFPVNGSEQSLDEDGDEKPLILLYDPLPYPHYR